MVTFESLISRKSKIAVVGLGYVGLPLAVYLSKHFEVVGYDLKADRIKELESGHDRTLEVSEKDLSKAKILFTSDPKILSSCSLIIVAVPTPIDEHRIPDLAPLIGASKEVGENMVKGSCIVFESTVYPGATEEVCVPILEQESGFILGRDFTVGYSPERINPGDKEHTLESIVKVVSGSDKETADFLSDVYGMVVKVGIHTVSSIKVAEAAKVIENTQRDLNIALMNELSMIFNKIEIDTLEVLEAAGTKWNFLPFKPGLVGGHCIGVDPYYLTFKAESLGYRPEMILAGRRINDNMGKYVAEQAVKLLIRAGKQVCGAKIAILGFTFKEDVPDLRNTKVITIINELKDYGVKVYVHDALAEANEAKAYYNLELQQEDIQKLAGVDGVIVAVIHKSYTEIGLSKIAGLCTNGVPLVMDLKGSFSIAEANKLGITYWRL
ncbi:MAG: nucleotide sugar dehydrogenase [Desulfobacteraceae bacterium]|nr:nucleotide sugar dehydrogenase [Desulfobacteraceae bacterium]MBC2719521.1 nucleotide sugar dehydrogenase [Desulfobacteraceae bacterium]